MNDETYTPCTKCGRPMKYCKGQCCGQPQGCGCREYGPMKAGCLREIQPSCPYQAVIPTLTVEDKSNLKDLADCFVHVSNINTTFYIDDKHRTIVTWAGPVEYENYDLDANTLGLRSQFLIDKANEYAAYYDKTGAYQLFNYSEGGEVTSPVRLRVVLDDSYWDDARSAWDGAIVNIFTVIKEFRTYVATYDITDAVSFINEETLDEIDLEDVCNMLESGVQIILDNTPINSYIEYDYNGDVTRSYPPEGTDGVSLSGPTKGAYENDGEITYYTRYSGLSFSIPVRHQHVTPLGVIIERGTWKEGYSGEEMSYVACYAQGIATHQMTE